MYHVIYPYRKICVCARTAGTAKQTAERRQWTAITLEIYANSVNVDTGVCEKNTPPEKKTLRKIGSQSGKSGAGEQFLPLDCKAEVHLKGVLFQTPVSQDVLRACGHVRSGQSGRRQWVAEFGRSDHEAVCPLDRGRDPGSEVHN